MSKWKTQSPWKSVCPLGITQEILCVHINILLTPRSLTSETRTGKYKTHSTARNHSLHTGRTCGEVGASPGFVEKVAGEGSCADDQKACSHHGDHPQQHQDRPEATVNCRSQEKRRRVRHTQTVNTAGWRTETFSLLHASNFSPSTLGSLPGCGPELSLKRSLTRWLWIQWCRTSTNTSLVFTPRTSLTYSGSSFSDQLIHLEMGALRILERLLLSKFPDGSHTGVYTKWTKT